ncbi:MAG: CAP domain-containing protein, partial [Rhodospirillales bacterium]
TSLLDHTGHLGLDLGKRLDGVDYRWSHAGENLAAGQRDAAEVIDYWSESPSHRRVMLGETYWEAGVAMIKSGNGTCYWVLITATQLVRSGDE